MCRRAARRQASQPGVVTITAAVSKSGETVNVGAQLTVTADVAGEPAFLLLADINDDDDTDDVISGRVDVVLNVERGDQTIEEVLVLVDGETVASQVFGQGMDMAPRRTRRRSRRCTSSPCRSIPTNTIRKRARRRS